MRRDVALLILYDADKKILLQHRTKNASFAPDHWAFFGGGIEEEETPEEALKREILEELCHTVKTHDLIVVQPYAMSGREGTKYVYTEYCSDKTHLKLCEGQNWGWFTPKETQKLKMTETDRKIIEFLKPQ
ncbi:NUDIX domain-containing protein [Candidatus Woesearchaeota archaeon]|nr:NUDIX domain-containing protein [Candidatus Woesearchaeota archaeon]